MGIKDGAFKSLASPENVLMLSGVVAAMHLGKVSPALSTLQASWGFTAVQAGFLLSLMQLAGAGIGVFMGMLSDRIGARTSIITGQALLFLASALALLVEQPPSLLGLRMLESCGLLMVVLPTPGLLRSLVSPSRMSFRLGLWGCYVALGTALALALGPLAIEHLGWQGWWLVPALASLCCVVAVALKVPPHRPRPEETIAGPAPSPWRDQLRVVLGTKGPWCVGIAFAMYAGQWMAIIGFLPTIYVDAGMSPRSAGLLTTLACLANIAGNVAAAALIHRGTDKRVLLMLGYLWMLAMTAAAFAPATSDAPGLRYLAIVLFSAVGGLIPATLFILAVESAPDDTATAATVGWVQQLTAMGMLLMPPALARIAQLAGGWHLTWIATGVAAMLGLALSASTARQLASRKRLRVQ
ncbi:MAG: MFS transporter [Delftia acidovorans]|uniref:MFS transporter n=1 Tax=Delftia acidovorans TaxID=80866 RepID=UPI002826CD95|nr:MFS transporter [Delftia acidovorans]